MIFLCEREVCMGWNFIRAGALRLPHYIPFHSIPWRYMPVENYCYLSAEAGGGGGFCKINTLGL